MYTNITPSIAGSQLGLEIFSNGTRSATTDLRPWEPVPCTGGRLASRISCTFLGIVTSVGSQAG